MQIESSSASPAGGRTFSFNNCLSRQDNDKPSHESCSNQHLRFPIVYIFRTIQEPSLGKERKSDHLRWR
jgi:hypothetical protein